MRFTRMFLGLIISSKILAASISDITKDALKSNAEYIAAIAGLAASQDGLALLKSGWLPQLTIDASKGFSDTFPNPNPQAADVNSAQLLRSASYGISLNQKLLDIPSWLGVQKQSYLVKKSLYNVAAMKQEILHEVATAYFQVLESISAYENQKAQLRAYKQQLHQVKREFDVGKSAKPELVQVESQYFLSEAETLSAKNEVLHNIQKLSQMTGKTYKSINRMVDIIPLKNPAPNKVDSWLDLMLKHNLDLKSARADLMASEQEIEIARTSNLPTLAFSTSVSRMRPIIFNQKFSTVRKWDISLSWPIFNGGANLARLAQSQHLSAQNRQSFIALQRQMRQKTINVFYDIRVGVSRVNAAKKAVSSALTAKEATGHGYFAGTQTNTEVLQSISRLYSAKLQLIKAKYEYLADVLYLKQLVGALSERDIANISRLFSKKTSLSKFYS